MARMKLSGDRAIRTVLGVVVLTSLCAVPTMVASQMFFVNYVHDESDSSCSKAPNYFTISQTDTCISSTRYSCNSTHWWISSYNSSDCSELEPVATMTQQIGCQTIGATFSTACVDTINIPISDVYTSALYSSSQCSPGTRLQISGYLANNTCYKTNTQEWASYSCDYLNDRVTIKSVCNSSTCEDCQEDSSVRVGQCQDGYMTSCFRTVACDITARQQCDVVFNQCDYQSSACECYQAWGQCVYNAGCDSDRSAESACREFCGASSCRCNFANPCATGTNPNDDSISNSLLVNLLLVTGSISIYFFLNSST